MNYYIGVSLASGSSMDSGVAVISEDNKIILLDKLYKMNDIIFFFENFSSLKNSKICVSVPFDRTMLEGKWRILSKPYQPVATNKNIPKTFIQKSENQTPSFRLRILRILDSCSVNIFVCSER